MRRRSFAAVVMLSGAVLTALAPGRSAAAPQTWEQDEGGDWRLVGGAKAQPQEIIPNETLDDAERFLSARRHGAARDRVLGWLKANPDAPDRDRALYLLAESYYQYGDRIRAFYHLDELMDFYPESRLFYPSLEKQFEIADGYLKGYKRRFLRLPLLGAEDEGVEMLYRIQERSPGSPVAERALLRTADFYYDSSQFDLASDAYTSYARSYPRSPDVASGRVRLRQAFSSLAQFRGLRFDATPLIDARAQLQNIQAAHPELARAENVADVIERIDRTLASKAYETADFYRRTGEPQAAVYYWRYVVRNYPASREAGRARGQLEKAPAWAMELPEPQADSGASDEAVRTPQGPPAATPAAPGAIPNDGRPAPFVGPEVAPDDR